MFQDANVLTSVRLVSEDCNGGIINQLLRQVCLSLSVMISLNVSFDVGSKACCQSELFGDACLCDVEGILAAS